MIKKTLFIFTLLLIMLTTVACGGNVKLPYSIEPGAYGFDKAVITNLITNDVIEKDFDEVLGDDNWRWVLSFGIGIKKDSKFIYNSGNNNYILLNGGNAYELIGDNTLKLHFPRWEGYDYQVYDVVIILGKHKLYG